MNARDDLIDEYGRADTAPLGTLSELKQKLDAYRIEVLVKAGVQYVDCPVCGAAQPVGGECGTCAFKARIAAELAARGHTDRDEVTRRNAALLEDRAHHADTELIPGLREGAELLTQVAGGQSREADAPADFFQPGHTYTHSRWQFRCDHISLHPTTSETRALGWLHTFTGQWQTDSLDPDDWASGDWTETTDTTTKDRT